MIKRILKWAGVLVFIIGVVFFYWNLTLSVETDKFNETIAAEQKILDTEKKERTFQRSQVDRLIFTLTNTSFYNGPSEKQQKMFNNELRLELAQIQKQLTLIHTMLETNHCCSSEMQTNFLFNNP